MAPTSELTPSPGALVALRPDAGWEDVIVMLVIETPTSRRARTLRDFIGRPYLWVMHPTLGPTQIPQGHVESVVQGRVV
jgi:hypothetical protein